MHVLTSLYSIFAGQPDPLHRLKLPISSKTLQHHPSATKLPFFSLVSRLLPSFLSHTRTVQKTGRGPGQFDHVRDDVLCVVLFMRGFGNRIIAHACRRRAYIRYIRAGDSQSRLVDFHSA